MIIITKTKQQTEYIIPPMPNFENRRTRVAWLRNQKMQAALSNIESVSIQIKDIKHMIYTRNPRLISLYTKFNLPNKNYSYQDEDYITITKNNQLNKSLIYALINTEWIINIENINNKTNEEIEQQCIETQNIISKLTEKKKTTTMYTEIDNQIKLFNYKLSCLSNILTNKEENTITKKLIKIN